jgi:hypothetical protein
MVNSSISIEQQIDARRPVDFSFSLWRIINLGIWGRVFAVSPDCEAGRRVALTLTRVSLDADSRAFHIASSLADAGLRSVVVGGRTSSDRFWGKVIELRSIRWPNAVSAASLPITRYRAPLTEIEATTGRHRVGVCPARLNAVTLAEATRRCAGDAGAFRGALPGTPVGNRGGPCAQLDRLRGRRPAAALYQSRP